MPRPREVLIYPGSPKTGTSALQRMLRCSVPELKAAGWNYLNDPREGDPVAPSTGNGLRLMVELYRASGKDPVSDFMGSILAGPEAGDPFEEFDLIAPPGERSIISTEAMVHIGVDAWAPIFELLESEGSRVRVVYCVRDLYSFSWSGWIQNVKANSFTGDFFEGWDTSRSSAVCRGAETMSGLAERFPSVLDANDLAFVHYETVREDLIPTLLDAGGIPRDACRLEFAGSSGHPVNRSLNQAETALMRKINQEASLFHSRWCGVTMTTRHGAKRADVVFHQRAHDEIAEHNADSIERFNAALPADAGWELSVLDRNLTPLAEADPEAIHSREARKTLEFLLSFEPEPELRELLESLLPTQGPLQGPLRRAGQRIRSAGAALRSG